MNTYIDEAYKCNEVGAMSCIIKLELVDQLVYDFKKLCPSVTHKVTLDWDDETLYRIRFTWEKGMFGVKKPIPVLLTASSICDTSEKPPPTPKYRPPSARW